MSSTHEKRLNSLYGVLSAIATAGIPDDLNAPISDSRKPGGMSVVNRRPTCMACPGNSTPLGNSYAVRLLWLRKRSGQPTKATPAEML